MFEGEGFDRYTSFIEQKYNSFITLYGDILIDAKKARVIFDTLTAKRKENYHLDIYYKKPDHNVYYTNIGNYITRLGNNDFVFIMRISSNYWTVKDVLDAWKTAFINEVKSKNENEDIVHLTDCEHILESHNNPAVVMKGKRTTYILVDEKITTQSIFSLMPRFIPSAFEENPLTEKETDFLEAIFYDDNNRIQKLWLDVVNENGTYREMINEQLNSFTTNAIDREMRFAKDEMRRIGDQITAFLNDIDELETNYRNRSLQYEALARRKEEPHNTELTDFLCNCKDIDVEYIDNDTIFFTVKTTIENYDPDAYYDLAENGFIFRNTHNYAGFDAIFNDEKNIRKLFDNIFNEDPMFKIQVFANYFVNAATKGIGGIKKGSTHYNLKANRVPNWHISNFACLGGYGGDMRTAMNKENYTYAMELCIQSAASLDVQETDQTAKPFIYSILQQKQPCLIDKEGNLYTAAQALAEIIIKEKEKQNEEI